MSARAILHVDMDAFYASIEQLDTPAYMGKPVIVGADPKNGQGRGVVAACSYEARKYGVHSALPISRAWTLCPEGIYVRPRMARYLEVSGNVMSVLRRFTDLVEPLSIDEAFLDITGSIALFGTPLQIARALKKEIRESTGLTASAGAAPNKFVAKIASDLQKPDGLVLVDGANVKEFLAPLPIARLWGVGPKTERKLLDMGFQSIADIQRLDKDELTGKMGALGEHLHRLSHGIDDRPVIPNWEAKSVSSETTFEEDTRDCDLLVRTIRRLAETVGRRLRNDGRRAGKITLKLRFEPFDTHTRQMSTARAVDTDDDIIRIALSLFEEFTVDRRVRLIGVAAGDIRREDAPSQLDLFEQPERQRKLGRAVDEIRARFGTGTIRRGPGFEK